jgi:hypothetical protein
MENLLLVLDELDDIVTTACHLAPRLLGFLAALALFGLTVLSFLFLPKLTLGALGVLLSVALIERARTYLTPLLIRRS